MSRISRFSRFGGLNHFSVDPKAPDRRLNGEPLLSDWAGRSIKTAIPRRFNLEKAHIILDEMVLDGCIVDTNKATRMDMGLN